MSNTPTAPGAPGNQQSISHQQIADAAAAGLELLDGEIPMTRTMRRRISLLEIVLQQLAGGRVILANAPPPGVELPPEGAPPGPDAGPEAPPAETPQKTSRRGPGKRSRKK